MTAGYRHSYRGGYPIPGSPKVQGHPSAQWDKHLLMVDTAECTAYELIQYDPFLVELLGVRSAMHGVKYPLNSVVPPTVTTNSPNTPMIGQYVLVDEVRRREVPHVLAFCSNTISSDHVWPARMSDGQVAAGEGLPMGSWIRLGDHVDPDSFGPAPGRCWRRCAPAAPSSPTPVRTSSACWPRTAPSGTTPTCNRSAS